MKDATVRPIHPSEWRALRELRLAALRESPHAFWRTLEEEEPLPDEHWRAWAARGAAGVEGVLLVAESSGKLVGMAATYHDAETATWNLIAMWVAPDARGAGAGARLVQGILGWARDAGHSRVVLWVNDDNPAAIALYERCGFLRTGRIEPQRRRPQLQVIEMAWTQAAEPDARGDQASAAHTRQP